MSLIRPLPEGAFDIIGDIHGEFDALCNLLRHLGYDMSGHHPQGRKIIFVGDFCDRGPDSPAVLALVESLVKTDKAYAVLGNHEINLLRDEAKDGSGWFFDERHQRDQLKYAPFKPALANRREDIKGFLLTLPVALERHDLRIVHAAWISEQVDPVRALRSSDVIRHYNEWDESAQAYAQTLKPLMAQELASWAHGLESPRHEPPFMHVHADYDAARQMMNPLRVMTSGVERKGSTPFFSSGKWRFAERVKWWNEYEDAVPVVIGHYWRRFLPIDRNTVGKGDPDLFDDTSAIAWHGKRGNIFCVDFSVGGRWSARKASQPPETHFKLAALQWPERVLQFDDGLAVATEGFREG